MPPMSKAKLIPAYLLFACIGLVIAMCADHYFSYIANDSSHYLMGAQSLAEGNGFNTSVLFFDEHYSSGELPAPQTVWPPGYSLATSWLHSFGLSSELAGIAVSTVSFAILFPIIFGTCYLLTSSIPASFLATLWISSMLEFWVYFGVSSDHLYLAFSSLFFLILLSNSSKASLKDFSLSLPTYASLSLIAGITFSVRYVGVFLLGTLVAVAGLEVLHKLKRNPKHLPLLFISLLPGFIVFALLTLRNYQITGGMRGGNAKVVENSLIKVIEITVASYIKITGGIVQSDLSRGLWFAIISVIVLGGLLIIGLFAIRGLFNLYRDRQILLGKHIFIFASFCYAVSYQVGLIYFAKTTFLTYDARYMLPIVPLLIPIVMYLAWYGSATKFSRSLLTISILSIVVCQLISLPKRVDAHFKPIQYRGIVAWLDSQPDNDEAILVVGDGQRIGFLSQRKTLVIPPSFFSGRDWNLKMFREVIEQYRVGTIVAIKNNGEYEYAEGIEQLTKGSSPEFLSFQKELSTAFIYRTKKAK